MGFPSRPSTEHFPKNFAVFGHSLIAARVNFARKRSPLDEEFKTSGNWNDTSKACAAILFSVNKK